MKQPHRYKSRIPHLLACMCPTGTYTAVEYHTSWLVCTPERPIQQQNTTPLGLYAHHRDLYSSRIPHLLASMYPTRTYTAAEPHTFWLVCTPTGTYTAAEYHTSWLECTPTGTFSAAEYHTSWLECTPTGAYTAAEPHTFLLVCTPQGPKYHTSWLEGTPTGTYIQQQNATPFGLYVPHRDLYSSRIPHLLA